MIEPISTRIFTLADQLAFSELSGDNNPLHVDPVIARRCLFGRPIVHGMHSLMWALDRWLKGHPKPTRLKSIRASFLKPVGLEQPVRLLASPLPDQRVRLDLQIDGVVVARIALEWADAETKSNDEEADRMSPDFPEQAPPEPLTKGEIASKSGTFNLHLPVEAVKKHFPQLARLLSPFQTATFLGASRLVGVKCPGLHSIFSELTLTAGDTSNRPEIEYRVSEFDERYGLVLMELTAPGMRGGIKAFVRPSPQLQPSFTELKKLVTHAEFSGERALVIGGSRGLGEVTTKLLAAGGARVQLTFHQGRADALRIAEEITAGGGLASVCPFNVMDLESAPPGLEPPTHVYYFATPFISTSAKNEFSSELFDLFCKYYVKGFADSVELLRGLEAKKMFYPSSVFVDESPPNLVEYAKAKRAGEEVCQALEKKYQDIKIYRPRLPRMATDQTTSLLPTQNPDPTPIMLNALKDFHAAGGG